MALAAIGTKGTGRPDNLASNWAADCGPLLMKMMGFV